MARILLRGEQETTADTFQRVASLYSKDELRFAQQALRKGIVDGSTYMARYGNCGCFFGTMAVAVGLKDAGIPSHSEAQRDEAIVQSNVANAIEIETFFAEIRPGDKPKNSRHALKADRWFTKAITGVAV